MPRHEPFYRTALSRWTHRAVVINSHSHNLVSAIKSGPLSAYEYGGYCRFTGAGPMVDSFIFQIAWIIVAAMIGLLVALIGAFLYPRRDHD